MLTDYLYQEKYNKSIKMLTARANFRIVKAGIYNLIFDKRNLDQSKIMELATCQYMTRCTNVIIQGFTGSGKTYLVCALGKEACKLKNKVKYVRLPDLLVEYDEHECCMDNV